MAVEYCETVIIGAGQQGCAGAAALRDLGREVLVLERAEIGQAWAHERWDSLLVGSGNRSVRFPGWEYDGDDPDGFMPGREVAYHLRRYVAERNLPVREYTQVRAVECPSGAGVNDEVRFRVHLATGGVVESRNLVAALGGYAKPRIPGFATDIDPVVDQLHSRDYRNPEALSNGPVLVVGAGISGQQIADELADAGRRVFLSVGRHRSFPRHYRGRSIHEWMSAFGLYDDFVTVDTGRTEGGVARLPGLPVVAVKDGTDELDLGTLADKGVVIVGSARGARGSTLLLRDNVRDIAQEASRSLREIVDKIDTGLRERGFIAAEQAETPGSRLADIPDFGETLDLSRHGIRTIIWCTGFGPDYRILPERALDEHGVPLQTKGIIGNIPGLYYAGLPDGNSLAPGAISATVENGRFIASQINIDYILRSGSPESLIA